MVIADREAAQSLLQSGRWADARAAFEVALAQDETPEALAGMALALLWHGELQESVRYNQRAYAAFRRQGDTVSAAFAALTTSIVYNCYLGNESAAQGWLQRAETAAGAGNPAPVQGWLWSFRGYLTSNHDLVRSEDLQRRALEHARLTGDRDLELVSLSALGAVLTTAGRVDEGLPLVDEAMAALSAGENTRLDTLVIVCCNMLMACETGADLRRAREWCAIADQFHDRYGCPFLYGECRSIYGALLATLGQWPEAEKELRSAVSLSKDVFPAVFCDASAGLAQLYTRQGRLEDAAAVLQGLEHEVEPALSLGELALARRQYGTAVRLLQRVLRHRDRQHIAAVRAAELLVQTRILRGELEEALTELQRLEQATSSCPAGEALARYDLAAGRVLLASNDAEAAISHFEDAVSRFAQMSMPFETARARLSLAEATREVSPELAVAEAETALEAFRRLGAQPSADAAAALLRSLGLGTRPGPRGVGLLTLREREVLALLENGLSNPEIADRLFISRKTAAHHVSSLLSKLGVRNRAEAIAYATRHAEGV